MSMATLDLPPAKVILLAVQAAIRADIRTLHALLATHPKTLHDLILRILLTYLPESLDSSEYVQLLIEYDSGHVSGNETIIDTTPLEGLSNAAASKKVRKLRLLSLRMDQTHDDAPEDPLILFLLHRAYRIDQQTGLIAQLPQLLAPFLERSDYLRDWVLATVLPLLRRNYEYHPAETETQSIEWFESLGTVEAVDFLFSKTMRTDNGNEPKDSTLARDLRCLAGPWLYGNNQWKRRKVSLSAMGAQTVVPLKGAVPSQGSQYHDWDAVFAWIINQNPASYIAVSDAIEQWGGAADVDLGSYGDPDVMLSQEDRRQINERYGSCALTASFRMPGDSTPALSEAHRILRNVVTRLKLPSISSLETAAGRLTPVPDLSDDGKPVREHIEELLSFLKNDEQEFSAPTQAAVDLLQALITSSYLLLKAGAHTSIEKTGSMLHNQPESYQHIVLKEYLNKLGGSAGADDKLWVNARKEVLWLHDWGKPPSSEGATTQRGRGVLGQIRRGAVEREILTTLLTHGRYATARSLYEKSPESPLSKEELSSTVLASAMHAFNNANNPNKTRGGVKKCLDILNAFPDTFRSSLPRERIIHLSDAANHFANYRLVLNSGEPYRPSVIHTHGDPIALVEKVLAQNTRTYTDIDNFLSFGEKIVLAGLTVRDLEGRSKMSPEQIDEQMAISRWRITSMCIDAALSENDFETAYSYVVNRLPSIGGDAYAKPPPPSSPAPLPKASAVAHPPLKVLDNWSWKAAFQTGKYRLNAYTLKPSHVGNSSANPEIRHLEQRMECLSQALLIAPPPALQEILNVFRRCEEELDAKIRQDAEQEDAWDDQGDDKSMPGRFGVEPPPVTLSRASAPMSSAKSRTGAEAPMSLLDLTRASAAQAQRSIAALTSVKGGGGGGAGGGVREKGGWTGGGNASMEEAEDGVKQSTVRKRDQLRSAAMSTMIGGIGWVIGAQTPVDKDDEDEGRGG
ncbi:hypothetical protein VC83_05238 [Pseudogymnoascus destructans]|uniref:Sec39 domain-containing protein n=1 Tax=Pseudogymnoascus destructans TaxID=655981 RepID=A0A177A8M0_9PEZI|nr:uncharacterized protein VC83_05238 [Pseudogymnoascus destructans]OAF58070.1 hypothetical protein VC83_05238 [Pseudogymnoascus destructans]